MFSAFEHRSLNNKQIIKILTLFRLANYPKTIRISAETLSYLKTFIQDLTDKILDTTIKDSSEREIAKSNFSESIKDFFVETNIVNALTFSAQLLQYYTMLNHQEVLASLDSAGFVDFLQSKSKTLGISDLNLFIMEYKLIKIYNDLCLFDASIKSYVAPVSNLSIKKERLLGLLADLGPRIIELVSKERDNIFYHYLHFCFCYCNAKVMDFEAYTKAKPISLEEDHSFFATQQLYLEQAFLNLENIERIQADAEDCKIGFHGQIFSLGRHIFDHLPSNNIASIKAHLQSMTKK
jgi:hypothetical protein